MSEAAKEEGEELRCKAEEAERQLDQQARESEVEAVRLRFELEGLRQLEEVRKQFDKEREWYRREHDQDVALIADLRARLQDRSTCPPDDADGSRELRDSESGADALASTENSDSSVRDGSESLHE